MIALEYLIALNNKPVVIRDNFNRDSSLCKSRGGFVAHSAVHRSTHFASAKEHPETFALYWWIADSKNQAAINLAVQSIECGQSVAATWRAVLPVLHPSIKGLVIHGGDRVKKLSVPIRADIPSGQAVLRLSATTFAELHCKLGKLGQAHSLVWSDGACRCSCGKFSRTITPGAVNFSAGQAVKQFEEHCKP